MVTNLVADLRWSHLLLLWMAGILLLIAVVSLHLFWLRPAHWLLPSPGSISGLIALLRTLWAKSPLLVVEILGIPLILLLVSIYWGVNRARGRL